LHYLLTQSRFATDNSRAARGGQTKRIPVPNEFSSRRVSEVL
jgi:hypothetical protein